MSSPARLVPLPKTTTQAAWIPTNRERYSTHQTAVAQEGPRGAQTQAAEDRRIAQRILPEEQPNKIGPLSCCTAPLQDFHWSSFSFSESRTAFSFARQKKKWFYPQGVRPIRKAAKPPTAGLWPQLGRQKPTQSKNIPLSHKRKSGFTRRRDAPSEAAQHPQGTSCL